MDKEKLKKVAVILPAYNEAEYITCAINSLKNQSYPSNKLEIIVVDNASSDNTAALATAAGATVIYQPVGPVGNVRNTGVGATDAEYIFFMDADCIAPKEWVFHGVEFLHSNENTVGGGGLKLRKQPKFLEKYWLLTSKKGEMLPSELLGSCLIIKKEHFDIVGGFDTVMTAGEDSDIHKRLLQKGLNVKMERELSVIHLGNATTVKAFLKRQIWHSENYFVNIKSSISDKVFWLIILYLLSITAVIFLPSIFAKVLFITIAVLCIIARSIKRISSSGDYKHYKNFHNIFLLDFIYMTGRTVGFCKGLFKSFRLNTDKK